MKDRKRMHKYRMLLFSVPPTDDDAEDQPYTRILTSEISDISEYIKYLSTLDSVSSGEVVVLSVEKLQ